MKLISIYIINIIIGICLLCLPACDNQWDDHTEVKNKREKETIMQVISSTPETSLFASILKKTGYDQLLSADKSITVFAPVNDALENVNMENVDELRALVKNHIAYLSYSVSNNTFLTDTIEMINTKRLKTGNLTIGDVSLVSQEYNITTANGILHLVSNVISPKLNIWEYLQTQTGYDLVDFIKSCDKKIMDKDKSVQIGIDDQGRPLYDTVWLNQNIVLEHYPINNEKMNFTYLLLESAAVNKIKTKYAKYFVRLLEEQRDSILLSELNKDCVLFPVKVDAARGYSSLDNVLIDVDPSNIVETYSASNGLVYKLSDIDIKVYENKIKTQIIEAEDFVEHYADQNAWSTRYRTWASGGKDVMMNGYTRDLVTYTYLNENNEEVQGSETFIYYYNSATNTNSMGRASNCYIKYEVKMNSVDYEIYWLSHDDIGWHSNKDLFGTTSEHWRPLPLTQKMLISLPDEKVVTRSVSDGVIQNNFSTNTLFAATTVAGGNPEDKEVRLKRYKITDADQTLFIPNMEAPFTGNDIYGTQDVFTCPRYGVTTILVANTTREKTTNSGLIFLDYIKLVPKVDVND